MAAETDPLPKLRAKLDELEVQVRKRLRPAVQLTSPPLPWTTRIYNRVNSQLRPTHPTDNGSPAFPKTPPKSLPSRIASFFGVGR